MKPFFQDYEHALVFYFRGLNKTIKAKKAFQTGIRMCTKAIMNAINKSSLAWSENHILQQLSRNEIRGQREEIKKMESESM